MEQTREANNQNSLLNLPKATLAAFNDNPRIQRSPDFE
jgi:hypothetical protein